MSIFSTLSLEQPIVCTTLNAAIDKRLYVDQFEAGQVHRVRLVRVSAGGKGVNVARVAHALGAPVIATGFAGGGNGAWIQQKLEEIGLTQRWVTIAEETRVCLNIISATGESTELLESGPNIVDQEADEFLQLWRELCTPGRWMTLSGSLPGKLSADYYGRLIAEARQSGAHVILDTSGDAIQYGAKYGPHTIKPNEDEFRQWFGEEARDEKAIRRHAEQLGKQGLENLIVSLGKDGCIAAKPDGQLWRAYPPVIEAVNTVGSGDAFVAGWTVACAAGMETSEALRYAIAAGTANALHEETGCVRNEDVRRITELVRIEAL